MIKEQYIPAKQLIDIKRCEDCNVPYEMTYEEEGIRKVENHSCKCGLYRK